VEAEYISECAVDLTMSSMSPETSTPSPGAGAGTGIVRPVAVKLPLHAVSDRMNIDAGADSMPPLRCSGKTSAGDAGALGLDRFPLSVNENMSTEAEEERWYDGESLSNSDDEVCDVFSRARRFQTAAAAVSSWLSCDVVDGRCCVKLLRALAAGGAGNRWNGIPPRWLHDCRTAAMVNAIELPRPFLDFTKMQVLAGSISVHLLQREIQNA